MVLFFLESLRLCSNFFTVEKSDLPQQGRLYGTAFFLLSLSLSLTLWGDEEEEDYVVVSLFRLVCYCDDC